MLSQCISQLFDRNIGSHNTQESTIAAAPLEHITNAAADKHLYLLLPMLKNTLKIDLVFTALH